MTNPSNEKSKKILFLAYLGILLGVLFGIFMSKQADVPATGFLIGLSSFAVFVLSVISKHKQADTNTFLGLVGALVFNSLVPIFIIYEITKPYTGGGADIGAGLLALASPILSPSLALLGFKTFHFISRLKNKTK